MLRPYHAVECGPPYIRPVFALMAEQAPARRDEHDAMVRQPAGGEPRQPAPAADPDGICWCCGGATAKRHCKVVCTNCGFMRDCSDQ